MIVFLWTSLKQNFLRQSIKISVWKRFIDDIFFIWTDSGKNLEKCLKELNRFYANIKFTFQKSKMKVRFLDVVTEIKTLP